MYVEILNEFMEEDSYGVSLVWMEVFFIEYIYEGYYLFYYSWDMMFFL